MSATPSKDFDLRQLVHEIASKEDGWTLDALVEQVYAATPRKMFPFAYKQALREYARIELGHLPTQDSQPGQSTAESQGSPAGLGHNHHRSRAALARAGFRMQVHVGPGSWKAIGLCTSAELLYAAAECDRMAEFNAQRADQYRALVKVMAESGAGQVKDLPTEIVEKVFTDDDH